MTLLGIIFWIGIAVLSLGPYLYVENYRKIGGLLTGLGFACIAYTVVMALRPQGLTNTQRAAVRNKLTAFLEESANMQRLCEDNKASVPDVAKWKIGVEKYLETLDHSYVVRFQEGMTDVGPAGVDAAHRACWSDLHVRDENLDKFFGDFRPRESGGD
jgi:hypothetical protein